MEGERKKRWNVNVEKGLDDGRREGGREERWRVYRGGGREGKAEETKEGRKTEKEIRWKGRKEGRNGVIEK